MHEFLVVTFPGVYFLYTYLKDFRKTSFVESINQYCKFWAMGISLFSPVQEPGRHLTRYRSCTVHYYSTRQNETVHLGTQPLLGKFQGTRLKGMEMALVWHEKVSRTALQTGSLSQTHTLLVQTHKHEYSQGKCRTMLSVIIKLE